MGFVYRWFTTFAGVSFVGLVALSIACGLYFVAELAEEHPTKFKKFLYYSLATVLGLHVVLLLDGLPFFEVLVGIVCHLCYALMLRQFPFIEMTSTACLLALIAIIVDHYIWFMYFGKHRDAVFQVMGFFLVMIWVVPFGLFIGLTVNDNILPGIGPNSYHGITDSSADGKSRNLFRGLMDYAMSWRKKDAVPGYDSNPHQTHFNKERFD